MPSGRAFSHGGGATSGGLPLGSALGAVKTMAHWLPCRSSVNLLTTFFCYVDLYPSSSASFHLLMNIATKTCTA
ncbi:hypothetical protein HU200_016718 [Digitaria exilis]|uniref:Uncharacterized protein n=1 Tax=Digitaria exilis TaxID=1010633 RepID=A0A835F7K4_9POAL|nr:hypothetical protein HU200_016718 [Digitaria exilis]